MENLSSLHYVLGHRALRGIGEAVDDVKAAVRAHWAFAAASANIWDQVIPGRRVSWGFVVFHAPLLFGGINLAKIIEAGVSCRRIASANKVLDSNAQQSHCHEQADSPGQFVFHQCPLDGERGAVQVLLSGIT
jgi:hypothetical protein